MTDHRRVGNLLGALAIGLADEVRGVGLRATGHGGETPAALVAVGHAPGLSNDSLARVLGLSHPGAVRLVDRLVADGLVQRRPAAADGRAVALFLTPTGRARRRSLLAERSERLTAALNVLDADEQESFAALLAKVLGAMPSDLLHGLSICRYCDEAVCSPCPVDAALGIVQQPV